MRYTAICIVDGPDMAAAIVADLGRAGFTDAEISITSATSPQITGTLNASLSRPPADAHSLPFGGRFVVTASLGLIAGLSAISIPETERVHSSRIQKTMMEGPATVDFNQSLSVAGTSQELDRSIACHLCPGNPLISVQTRNCYEIETIMEIFREGGSIHCEHFIDDGGPEDQEPHPLTTNLVHNHSTTLTDRVRETA